MKGPEAPKWLPEAPRGTQEAPRGGQREPKRCQRWVPEAQVSPKRLPGDSQGRPKRLEKVKLNENRKARAPKKVVETSANTSTAFVFYRAGIK